MNILITKSTKDVRVKRDGVVKRMERNAGILADKT